MLPLGMPLIDNQLAPSFVVAIACQLSDLPPLFCSVTDSDCVATPCVFVATNVNDKGDTLRDAGAASTPIVTVNVLGLLPSFCEKVMCPVCTDFGVRLLRFAVMVIDSLPAKV